MLVKSARRYINTLDKILKNQHNDIITKITEYKDYYISYIKLNFHIEGRYCFVAAHNDTDTVVYYVEGSNDVIEYIISDRETQKESMYKIINKIYDLVVTLSTETAETSETSETEATTPRNTIETLPPQIYNDTDINPVCMKCQDENLLPYNCNDCNNKKLRKKSFYGMFGGFPTITEMYNNKCFLLSSRQARESLLR